MSPSNDIIIVEDDRDDREIIAEVFRDIGKPYKIIFFDNGPDAFNYLMSIASKPFVIISDINIPGMSGIELKRKIDSTDYLKKKAIPFVFLTTADSPNIVEQAYQLTNLQGYFKKQNSLHQIKQQAQLIIDYWETAIHPGLENASAPHPSK